MVLCGRMYGCVWAYMNACGCVWVCGLAWACISLCGSVYVWLYVGVCMDELIRMGVCEWLWILHVCVYGRVWACSEACMASCGVCGRIEGSSSVGSPP